MTIAVICVYNDIKAYEEMLCASLKNQNISFELIGIDNRKNKFISAAKALNYGAKKSNADVLIFSHQDIYLKDNNSLKRMAKAILKCPIGTIVGTQGVRDKNKKYYSNITAGSEYITEYNYDYKDKLYEVSCVDEGFFGMRRETWEQHNFDEKLCDNWHLYCVEACLWARKNGHKVYVCMIQLHHFSMGRITIGYMDNLRKLCKVYRKDFKYIWTTCYKVRTNVVYINCLYWLWVMNRIVRRKSLN